MTEPLRILLADDQALIRGAMAALLSMEPDLQVVAETGDGTDVVDLVRDHRVDVALIDIEMPGIDGIAVVARLTASGLPCRSVIVTTFGRPGYLRRALAAGASGFVVKDTPADQLAAVVRRVHAGLRVIDPSVAEEDALAGANPLTGRERDVLRGALTGATVRQLAADLHLSVGTVRNHLSAAIGKTSATTRTEAAVAAQRHGWL
ncbi:response regulator transcription factor [Microbacterium gorillae]|uniref:response regulator transcription factor n=1 Tax=Microbacterium gorillae TaxID=1231063 RepID=UPI00059079AE|nr:response regulator transcription factor [Microbacterium gorillae]